MWLNGQNILSLDFINNLAMINGEDYAVDSGLTPARPNAFSNGITFSRANATATRVNRLGLIETVAANTPRFDYDPITLQPKGLLIEESRTNLLTYSSDFGNPIWTKAAVTTTPNSGIAPDGTNTLTSILNTAGTVSAIYQSIGAAVASIYTASIYLYAGTTNTASLALRDSTSGTNYAITATVLSGPGTVSIASSTIANISNLSSSVPTRVSITLAATATAGNALRFSCYPESTSAGLTTGKTILAWGSQVEVGAFATSYIPTVASIVTRSSDACSMTGTNFSNWYNPNEGTIVLSYDLIGIPTSNTQALTVAGSGGNAFYMRVVNNSIQNLLYTLNLVQCGLTVLSTTPVVNTIYKNVFGFAANNFAGVQNNGTLQTDTSGIIPLFTIMYIGGNGAGQFLNGHIRSLYFYPERLPNATLQALST